jgi:hypothetical protein
LSRKPDNPDHIPIVSRIHHGRRLHLKDASIRGKQSTGDFIDSNDSMNLSLK